MKKMSKDRDHLLDIFKSRVGLEQRKDMARAINISINSLYYASDDLIIAKMVKYLVKNGYSADAFLKEYYNLKGALKDTKVKVIEKVVYKEKILYKKVAPPSITPIKTLDFNEITERIKDIISHEVKATKVLDKNVAEKLGISQATFATIKQRGNIPCKQIIKFCAKRKININWLFFGQSKKDLIEINYNIT